MNKGIFIKWPVFGLLVLSLLAVPFTGACAKPAPAPAPKPSPAPTPTAKPHEPYEILVSGVTAGGAAYILSAGIIDLINKNSSWLKASVEETFGGSDDVIRLSEKPEARKRFMGLVTNAVYFDALEGNKPFTKKYTGLKAAMFQYGAAIMMISTSPAITSKEGLVGKRVVVGKELSSTRQFAEIVIRDCWDMWDKIKPQPMAWAEGKTAVLDGLADAMVVITGIGAPGEFLSSPTFEEIMATRQAYFFGPTKEEVARASKVTGRNYTYLFVPKGAISPKQTMDFGGVYSGIHYFVHPEFPDDVLTEFMRIVYENTDKLPKYHVQGKGTVKERLGWLSLVASVNDVHPAAVKFFKERNIPLVIAGGPDPVAK